MSIRVLLVDDEPDMRMLVRLTLDRTEDIEVVGEASSGLEAISQLESLTPDVLLLDHMMPGGLTGIETAAKVFNAAGSTASPRIVLFTAWATAELSAQATAVGIHRFLSKDEFALIADTIREVATV
jgi:DNA-binding NarL/FixJ family response regulator